MTYDNKLGFSTAVEDMSICRGSYTSFCIRTTHMLDNLKIVCKKNLDKNDYIFKMELTDENPTISVRETDGKYDYIVEFLPEYTKNLECGKYFWTMAVEFNGATIVLDYGILDIKENCADTSGGVQDLGYFEDLIDGDAIGY